jgi:nuclear pore complex protein Nup107
VLKGPLPSVITLPQQEGENELFLLRSIEWTIFLDTTYDTALEQANIILRYFLGTYTSSISNKTKVNNSNTASGRVRLAQRLLEMVPSDLASISEPEDRATEYLHYRQFFVIWEILEDVVECQAVGGAGGGFGMGKEEYGNWVNRYRVFVL